MSMNNAEFRKLQMEIKATMDELEKLQKIYIRETGRRFITFEKICEQEDSPDCAKCNHTGFMPDGPTGMKDCICVKNG